MTELDALFLVVGLFGILMGWNACEKGGIGHGHESMAVMIWAISVPPGAMIQASDVRGFFYLALMPMGAIVTGWMVGYGTHRVIQMMREGH